MNMSLIGAWDFGKFPIFPFVVRCSDYPNNHRLLASLQLIPIGCHVRKITIHSAILVEFEISGRSENVKFEVSQDVVAPYIKERVNQQARAVYNSLLQREADRVVKTIEDQCYAALRRIANNNKKGEGDVPQLSEIDSSYYKAILVKPQELGESGGVPMAVFHRLMAAGKARINKDGLVESTSNGDENETD